MYEGKAASAFIAVNKIIKKTMDDIHHKNRHIFANPKDLPSENFIEIPDYHSACVVAATTGTPLHKLKPGPKTIAEERIQLNAEPLDRYRKALINFVNCL
jgi:hypothetical protein